MIDEKIKPFKQKLNRITSENLIVPGVIGPAAKFKNVKEWII